jgi:hypothetical protein
MASYLMYAGRRDVKKKASLAGLTRRIIDRGLLALLAVLRLLMILS